MVSSWVTNTRQFATLLCGVINQIFYPFIAIPKSFNKMTLSLLLYCIVEMTMATNNTHFHRDIIEHVEGFIDLQSMRNALFVDRTWHSVIHPARLSRVWDSLKNQTEQYINDTITTTIISKDEMEDYLLCIVAGLQWQDDLTQFSHDKALYTHVPFWHTINSFRKTSPTYGKMVNITRSLMDHKVKQLFDDAATIKSCFKHLVKEFPLRAFNDMHQTIAIIWINMRDALLNGFFHGINND
eukprot:114286_1